MSGLSDAIQATVAGCYDPLHPNYYALQVTQLQIRCRWGVNKSFWKSWDTGILELDCPGYPTQAYFRFYPGTDPIAGRIPEVAIGGYAAVCEQPGSFLGTSDWLWMAILNYYPLYAPPLPIRQAHIQYKNTNAGSVGMVLYPQLPWE